MKESGYFKDCQCTIVVNNMVYKGMIVDFDKNKLKFIKQVSSGSPIPTFEIVYIFNHSKNIISIHYDLNELKSKNINSEIVSDQDSEDNNDFTDPLERENVKDQLSNAIRNEPDSVSEIFKESKSNLINAIQKKFASKPPVVKTTNYQNPFMKE